MLFLVDGKKLDITEIFHFIALRRTPRSDNIPKQSIVLSHDSSLRGADGEANPVLTY
jgi:hypothetical protein